MSRESPDTDAQSRWKHRYYEALDELEQKEKNWREAERLIRHLISRLTLAADSRHKALTHELNELRNAVRDGRDFLKLREHIDLITEQVNELDKMRKQEDRRGHPATLFVEVLEKLDLPDTISRDFKLFRKQVKQLQKDAPADAMNEQLVEILKNLAQQPGGENAPPTRKQRLLDRILSRQKGETDESTDSAAEPPAEPSAVDADVQEQIDKEIKKRSSDPHAKFVAPAVGDLLLQLMIRMPVIV